MAFTRPKTPDDLIAIWQDYVFEYREGETHSRAYDTFADQYRSVLYESLHPAFGMVATQLGHFILSGFLEHRQTGALVYWSVSDVRFFPNAWHRQIRIRHAAHSQGYAGGPNYYTTLEAMPAACAQLVESRLS